MTMIEKRERKRKRTGARATSDKPSTLALGATFEPLSKREIGKIADTALMILSEIGVAEFSDSVKDTILSIGGKIRGDRLVLPQKTVEQVIKNTPKEIELCGQIPEKDMKVGGRRGYTGTGGAAPNILDMNTGAYRPSNLIDLYDAARLCDFLDHIHFFSRPLVARDMETPLDLDINTAFAALLGTTKHVMISASNPEHLAPIAQICYLIAGSETAFRKRPFVSFNTNHIIPPLRFHSDSMAVMAEAIRLGFPVHANVFGQLGASSPVTIAGSVAQTIAETLAGLVFAHAINPNAKTIAGPRSMITDLRTGGLSGGSGEQAIATAVCAQVLRHLDLPCSVIAGATDSKMPDSQAGYEKALNISTSLQAGANLITQACGMQASLMGVSLEAYVIDNDMLGAILRSNVGPEVNKKTLAFEEIQAVTKGEGHFLGQAETHARMRSDFLYPEIADRRLIEDWHDSGKPDLYQTARSQASRILKEHFPDHLDPVTEKAIRTRYNIRLSPKSIKPKTKKNDG